ncbi:hypothetical protein E4U42_000803 [Claviceps africana]|uniref:Small-subunit processome Utp12 domain-containing protein n=1 Tax=Claviceps africana TaxID=83212 RepID=A0A8K0JAH3_9HYPO|nr:hypothetical protein E4U42_000803 [Claviceps africana]
MPMSTKRKAPGKVVAPVVKSSAKVPTKNTIDETRASISGTDALQGSQLDMIEISSDAASDDEDISDAEMQEAAEPVNGDVIKKDIVAECVNGKHSKNEEDDAAEESDNGETSPSFGELLRGNDAIDVSALLQQSSSMGNMTTQPSRTAIVPPSHQSLTTVLTQALKTDDTELLESCLHTTDLPTVRNTIERIDSSLAGNLLTKLAARLYRRPGRAGNLMTWVQWTLVSHGGALASQPKVIQSLNSLQKVLAERAKGLNSLLALKGKLDLLQSQMDLRRRMQCTSGLLRQGESSDYDEDEDVIWVEGETDPVSRKDVNGYASGRKKARSDKKSNHADDNEDDQEEEEEEDEGAHMPNTNGDSQDEEEEEDPQEEDDSDAAEESLDENEVDHDDVDESLGEDEESEVEAAAPPSKMQKVSKAFSKKK